MKTKTAIFLSLFATATHAEPVNWTNLSAEVSEWVPVSESADTGIRYALNSGYIYAVKTNTGGVVVRTVIGHLLSNNSISMGLYSIDCQGGQVVENERGVLGKNGRFSMLEATPGMHSVPTGSVMEEIGTKACGFALTKMGMKPSRNLGE
jgi:hypothetical protein